MSATPAPTKLGFLSLEFIIGDSTYWMTTGLGRDGFYFTVIPYAQFGRAMLFAQFISRESDYSEIMVMSDGATFKQCQKCDGSRFESDLTQFPRLSWNEMIAVVIDAMPLSDQSGLWHHHVVRKTDPSLQINDVAYKVTAFLPPPEHEGVFAVLGEDYKPPENPNFITFQLPDEASFKARLKQFRVEEISVNGQFYPAL